MIRDEQIAYCIRRRIPPREEDRSLGRDMTYVCTEGEKQRLEDYHLKRYEKVQGLGFEASPFLVYNLGDGPLNRVSWSLLSRRMPTLRKYSTLYYFPLQRR